MKDELASAIKRDDASADTGTRRPRSPRDAACDCITERARRFPDVDLESSPDWDALLGDPREAALAHAIDQAVARRWLTLVKVIQHALNRPWETLQHPLQAALLGGAAQLLLMDRLPDHAVLNETVGWIKRQLGPGAAGLVNAVLRKVAALRVERAEHAAESPLSRQELPLEDGRMLRLAEPVFSEPQWVRLAEQTAHPVELLTRWVSAFGEPQTRLLALHSLVHPPVLVAGFENFDASSHLSSHEERGFAVFRGSRGELVRLLAAHPVARVQDPASAAPVAATTSLQPRLIVDACAGQGTKTRQLAAVHPTARIIASDIHDARRSTLRETFAGSGNVEVIEPRQLAGFAGQADLLVLDVPCSNTGVLARRVEAKYRASAAAIGELVGLQRQIVADSIALLAPNGTLLYATCSIDAAENQQQSDWISRQHDLTIIETRLILPKGLPGEDPSQYHDGGYFVLLRRGPDRARRSPAVAAARPRH